MNLYFLRHGIAVEKSARDYPEDSERPLTLAGKREIRVIAKALLRLGFRFDKLLSSPYLRARQTAEVLALEMKPPLKVEFSKNLVPGVSPMDILKEVRGLSEAFPSVLLVGHESFLSQCLCQLLSGNAQSFLTIKKGGLCKVRIEGWDKTPQATLRWLLTPKQLAMMAHH